MRTTIFRNIIALLIMFFGMLLFTIVLMVGSGLSADADTTELLFLPGRLTLWDKVAAEIYFAATLVICAAIILGMIFIIPNQDVN